VQQLYYISRQVYENLNCMSIE